ncbi:MAG: hypothetical protein OET41_16155 [Xanthomonadales bacterium]|nr:hypothetical protein [Xanthomonadales bacterium]
MIRFNSFKRGLVLSATLLCFGLLATVAQAQTPEEFQAVVDKAYAK